MLSRVLVRNILNINISSRYLANYKLSRSIYPKTKPANYMIISSTYLMIIFIL